MVLRTAIVVAVVSIGALAGSTHGASLGTPSTSDSPMGTPIPSDVSAADLLSTDSEDGDVHSPIPGADFCRSAPVRPISLPADDAPHSDVYLEFWQWPMTVETDDGHRLALFVTFENKPWAEIGLAQFTITDLSNGTFHSATEWLPGPPAALGGGFSVDAADLEATGGNGHDQIRFRLDGYELDLTLSQTKPPVFQVGDGHVTAYCNDFYLYSRYRMTVSGTVIQAGRAVGVRGTSSFDHMWGFFPDSLLAETLALKAGLDDGRDLFVGAAKTPRSDAVTLRFGAISDAEGAVTILHRDDFSLTPTRYWRRDATCAYPVEWDVEIAGLHLHVRAVVDDAELRTSDPVIVAAWPEFPAYWDGELEVSGDATGRGWLDLTHYCFM